MIAPPAYANQNRRNDHRAVSRKATKVPWSPAPRLANAIAANANAMTKAVAIHEEVLSDLLFKPAVLIRPLRRHVQLCRRIFVRAEESLSRRQTWPTER